MPRKLVIVAISGIALSAVCLGAGAALVGGDFADDLGDGLSLFGDRPRCERVADAAPANRVLAWDGSDHAVLAVPGEARYAPGNDGRLHVSGDPQAVAHVRLREGTIEMDCRGWHGTGRTLTVTLPGRLFDRFVIAGDGRLLLNGLRQDHLRITIAGSGSARADGTVDTVELHIAGSGDADMAGLAAQVVKVRIAGSGNADIAPREEADIHIAGSGDVNLHTSPRKLETHIAGSGRIHNIAPSG